MDGLHIAEAVIGEGFAQSPDQHTDAAERPHDAEAVLVGQVIAHEDRPGAGKRRFDHEGAHRPALVHARGKEFDHHDAALQLEAGAARQIFGEHIDHRLQGRFRTVMQGHAQGLFLDMQFRIFAYEGGDFLPGRGLLDMKSGLAAGIVALERFADLDESPGNVLFVATPDEENRSRGMISLRNTLPDIAEKYALDIVGGINLDSTSDEGDGADGRALYLGSVGKYSPFAFVVGRPTHAGYAYHGVSAHLIAAEIMRAIEFNDQLTDEAFGERSPPPVCLEARDVRHGYEVTTPAHVWLSFNWLTHSRSSTEMLAGFRSIVAAAIETALGSQRSNARRYFGALGKERPAFQDGQVLTYGKLRDLVRQRGGEQALGRIAAKEASLAGENDQLAVSRELVALAVSEAGLEGPAVIIGFSSLHYPMVHINQAGDAGRDFHDRLKTAIATIEARHATTIATKQFFAGISDMSFFGRRPDLASTSVLIDNTPAAMLSDHPPSSLLTYPVVNIGPWGRDYHQKWERVHAPYTFGILPDLIYEAALRCFGD